MKILSVGIELSFVCIAKETLGHNPFSWKTICLLVSTSSLWRSERKYDVGYETPLWKQKFYEGDSVADLWSGLCSSRDLPGSPDDFRRS